MLFTIKVLSAVYGLLALFLPHFKEITGQAQTDKALAELTHLFSKCAEQRMSIHVYSLKGNLLQAPSSNNRTFNLFIP